METKDLLQAKVYVTTFHKVAIGGAVNGGWLQLSDYKDKKDFLQACKELHPDETEPEFYFDEPVNLPGCFISSSYINGLYWELLKYYYKEESYNKKALSVYLDLLEPADIDCKNVKDITDDFGNCFQGYYKTELEFAQSEALIYFDTLEDKELEQYFNYEKFSRDLFESDFKLVNGVVFCVEESHLLE